MPQLVNSSCVLCGKRIGAVYEGEFCQACGNPVHHACVKSRQQLRTESISTLGSVARLCAVCGSEIGDEKTTNKRLQELAMQQAEQARQEKLKSVWYHDCKRRKARARMFWGGFLIFVGVLINLWSMIVASGTTATVSVVFTLAPIVWGFWIFKRGLDQSMGEDFASNQSEIEEG